MGLVRVTRTREYHRVGCAACGTRKITPFPKKGPDSVTGLRNTDLRMGPDRPIHKHFTRAAEYVCPKAACQRKRREVSAARDARENRHTTEDEWEENKG